ncbi:MAG: hypothetical protein ACK5YY_03130 [Alphaproteobacteria bacterium]
MNSLSTARGEQTVDGENYSHSSKGNDWLSMILSDQGGGVLTSSNEARYGSTHTLLFDHLFDLSRRTNANIVSMHKNDSARPRFSNPLIKLPNDVWTPSLENILLNGILVEEINLKRFTNSGEINEIVQDITFKNNILQALVQDDDYVWIEFRTTIYTNVMNRRLQNTQQAGSNSVTYDISQAVVTTGAGAA